MNIASGTVLYMHPYINNFICFKYVIIYYVTCEGSGPSPIIFLKSDPFQKERKRSHVYTVVVFFYEDCFSDIVHDHD